MDAVQLATSIVQKLVREGFIAYFAGGWVRDHIMGHPSDDIDIATNATPAQIMNLFPRTNLVGLQFGVVIVTLDGHQFEVATFRKDLHYIDGRHPEGIEMGTPLEDAQRRDFTINGMFYDPLERVIHDYVNGIEDIKKGIVRTIGDPHERIHEDRLRMLRAFRFEARFGFAMDIETQVAIQENAESFFPAVAMERVWQEFNKMAAYSGFDHAIVEMHRLTLLDVIFPELKGRHINDMKQCVASYAHFPENTPTILYLMELFPEASLNDKIEKCLRIKASNKDIKLIEFFDEIESAVKDGKADDYRWAHLLAHPHAQMCLEVIAARLPAKEREYFLLTQRNRFEKLKQHIQRIADRKPLVTADRLKAEGITPGVNMGLLLKEAEKLSILHEINDADEILRRLAQSPLWKKMS